MGRFEALAGYRFYSARFWLAWPPAVSGHGCVGQLFPYQLIGGLLEIFIGKPRHEADKDAGSDKLKW